MTKTKETIENVIKNKKALNYIFNPRADKNLVYNLGPGFGYNGTEAYAGPMLWNGEILDSGRGRYPGDVIDLFLGKNLDKAPFPLIENYPKNISKYTKSRYGIDRPRVYDIGEVDDMANPIQRESTKISKNGEPVLDPGGHMTYKTDELGSYHYDIWKYNPDDFMRKWAKKDWSWPKRIAARAATSFIDKQGEPIAHIWVQPNNPANAPEINFEEIKFEPNLANGGSIHIKPENRGKLLLS